MILSRQFLLLPGLFDKTGKIPLNGEDLCFEIKTCAVDADGN